MSRYMNGKFSSLEAYTPGEQPTDMKYIKLNTNESPYPPSQGVIDAINNDEVKKLNLYPDPECKQLKRSIAELYGALQGAPMYLRYSALHHLTLSMYDMRSG